MTKKTYKILSLAEEINIMETGVVYLIPAPFCSIGKEVLEGAQSTLYSSGE